ncbi:respiratory nitrate reductase subunit gamma, partial [Streptococcus pneumoniae]|uniref:respiratory nitrate reductase subunit gamma n=1 Tax=Streptococcus pneumoniae TaxID=1313 RepID=UPI00122F0829
KGLLLWNAVPVRLYLLEITGLGLGFWALVGTYVLLARRISVARVRAASTGKGLLLWNAVPVRLYLLEITGLGLGFWALVGTYV